MSNFYRPEKVTISNEYTPHVREKYEHTSKLTSNNKDLRHSTLEAFQSSTFDFNDLVGYQVSFTLVDQHNITGIIAEYVEPYITIDIDNKIYHINKDLILYFTVKIVKIPHGQTYHDEHMSIVDFEPSESHSEQLSPIETANLQQLRQNDSASLKELLYMYQKTQADMIKQTKKLKRQCEDILNKHCYHNGDC